MTVDHMAHGGAVGKGERREVPATILTRIFALVVCFSGQNGVRTRGASVLVVKRWKTFSHFSIIPLPVLPLTGCRKQEVDQCHHVFTLPSSRREPLAGKVEGRAMATVTHLQASHSGWISGEKLSPVPSRFHCLQFLEKRKTCSLEA